MKRIHILLAEDNLGDIILIREAFAERNLIDRISVVKDGKQALEFIYKDGKYVISFSCARSHPSNLWRI